MGKRAKVRTTNVGPGGDLVSVLHVRVAEDERRKMAAQAAADQRPLSTWARVQLLRALPGNGVKVT